MFVKSTTGNKAQRYKKLNNKSGSTPVNLSKNCIGWPSVSHFFLDTATIAISNYGYLGCGCFRPLCVFGLCLLPADVCVWVVPVSGRYVCLGCGCFRPPCVFGLWLLPAAMCVWVVAASGRYGCLGCGCFRPLCVFGLWLLLAAMCVWVVAASGRYVCLGCGCF